MFCDLVGSTALSARLDPEDLHEVVGAYHRCCADRITEAGGFVAKYMGDGVLAYFGYPLAHEHDAEHAVQAGLALVEAAPQLTTAAGVPLQVRVGIATGLVVVGDLIGAGAAQEQAVVGKTPNPAARLQALAEPDAVVIADGTRRLLGNLFELRDLGARDLKGIAWPARAWVALRASSVGSRFDALHPTGLAALVGRKEESELLLRRWSRAKTGEGQMVLLSGEAGIGKSRLTAALLERLTAEPAHALALFLLAAARGQSVPPDHRPDRTRRQTGVRRQTAGEARQARCAVRTDLDLVRGCRTLRRDAVASERWTLSRPRLTPEQRRQRTVEALISQLAGLARRQPVLMIFEDLHWIDPTSLEVLGRTVDRIKTLPALLIVTFRPEFNAPWVGQSHVVSLTLNRLGEREAATIIARLVGNKALPADVLAEIVERTDGIPLFVEEMTKAVLEAESEGAARGTVAAVPSPTLAVPASLYASLMARLDRLGPAKEVAQIGSAIGREFSHALLAAVARKPEAELGSPLDRLVQSGLLSRQGVPPQASYLFKHALVQDAAYDTLLREPRRALHARIAETFESRFSEVAESQPEILAHHHRSRADREGRGCVGQGGPAVTGALGGRSRGPTHPRPRPDRDLASHGGIAPRAEQASGRVHPPTHACQRLCCRRNQGGCGAGTRVDRASRSAGRAFRGSAAAVLGPLHVLGSEQLCIQRRCLSRSRGAVPGARGEAKGDSPAHGRASHNGNFLTRYGGHQGRPGALGSGDRALRSCRTSSAGDAIWPRHSGLYLSPSVERSVVARLSRGRAERR
jgi:class 3 adenylate cyclase